MVTSVIFYNAASMVFIQSAAITRYWNVDETSCRADNEYRTNLYDFFRPRIKKTFFECYGSEISAGGGKFERRQVSSDSYRPDDVRSKTDLPGTLSPAVPSRNVPVGPSVGPSPDRAEIREKRSARVRFAWGRSVRRRQLRERVSGSVGRSRGWRQTAWPAAAAAAGERRSSVGRGSFVGDRPRACRTVRSVRAPSRSAPGRPFAFHRPVLSFRPKYVRKAITHVPKP